MVAVAVVVFVVVVIGRPPRSWWEKIHEKWWFLFCSFALAVQFANGAGQASSQANTHTHTGAHTHSHTGTHIHIKARTNTHTLALAVHIYRQAGRQTGPVGCAAHSYRQFACDQQAARQSHHHWSRTPTKQASSRRTHGQTGRQTGRACVVVESASTGTGRLACFLRALRTKCRCAKEQSRGRDYSLYSSKRRAKVREFGSVSLWLVWLAPSARAQSTSCQRERLSLVCTDARTDAHTDTRASSRGCSPMASKPLACKASGFCWPGRSAIGGRTMTGARSCTCSMARLVLAGHC